MTRRDLPARLHVTLALLAVVIASLAGVSSAQAVPPAPAWRISSVPNPTAFSASDATVGECAPCDKYQLRITNVGGAPSNGTITVTDTLPAGVTTSGTLPSGNEWWEWTCTPEGEGATSIQCTTSSTVGALKQAPSLTVYVQVASSVPADSEPSNVVKVESTGATTVTQSFPTRLNPSAPLPFGLADFGSYPADEAGLPDRQAAGHPNSLTTSFDVTSAVNLASGHLTESTRPSQDIKDIVIDLPVGFIGDPLAAQQCPIHDLIVSSTGSGCPLASQVGVVSFNGVGSYDREFYQGGRQNIRVYNMVPERGYPAEFGFLFAEKSVLMYASVVGNGAVTHVRVSIPGTPASQLLGLQGAIVTFFGDPTVQDGLPGAPVAFFTNPSDCSGEPLVTSIHVDSWQTPGARNPDGTPNFSDSAWKSDTASTPAMEGCGALHFNPTISLTPDVPQAGAPTGLSVDLEVPQSSDPSIPATPDLKRVVVTLPAGMVLSPSAANGLGACSPQQIGLENNDPPSCPDSSKIGTVEVETPLLEHALKGSVYLAQQGNAGPAQGSNPFNSLLAIYVVAEGSGVVVKLPGKVEANEHTGQLTTTFDEDPQLPFSDFKLHFESGPRAPLSNPPTCGTYTPQATLSSWSGQTVQSNRPLAITQGENGGPCPGSVFAPSFTAGTANNQAGGFSPFSVTFSRSDSDQTLGGITVHAPPGLLGKIAGVPQCLEAQANAGTCGAESLIGHTTVGAGPGADPFYVGGSVYLTGPYKGAPFGLSIVVPVVAGPFNLGTEVVRAAIAVDPYTAQITVTSNPLPTIKQGIPLQIRTVNVTIDRSGFMFNPTNCSQLSVAGTITSTQGASAGVSSPFEAANCANLPFKPKFTASTSGKTSRQNGTSLKVRIVYPGANANLRSVKVKLPKQLPSRLSTLQKACADTVFNVNPAACPAPSRVGTATTTTPVLPVPLSGPVYFVSHGTRKFPDLVMILQGDGVTVILDGETFISKAGITSSTFRAVPDVPFSSFELNLPKGPYSTLTNNGNLCKGTLLMPTALTGQNGAVIKQSTKIAVTDCPKAKKKAKPKKKK